MKLFALAALAALSFGQDSKMVSPPAPLPPPTERALSETEVLKLQNSLLQMQVLNKDYKIDEYNSKAKPIIDAQQAIAVAACKSVGVPEEKITTECGITTGIGQDGKPTMGADGKPVQPRVWWQKPESAKPAK